MPRGLQVAAAWSWRVILVVAVIFGLGWVARYLSEVFVPVAIAILLAAMLSPVANRLRSWGLPRGAATAITVLGGMALIAGASDPDRLADRQSGLDPVHQRGRGLQPAHRLPAQRADPDQ